MEGQDPWKEESRRVAELTDWRLGEIESRLHRIEHELGELQRLIAQTSGVIRFLVWVAGIATTAASAVSAFFLGKPNGG